MAEYIKREAANDALLEDFGEHQAGFYSGLEIARSIIASLPAADVRPVVRGEWVEDHTEYVCSVCGQRVSDEIPYMISPPGMPSWCPNPNCGAQMKGAGR